MCSNLKLPSATIDGSYTLLCITSKSYRESTNKMSTNGVNDMVTSFMGTLMPGWGHVRQKSARSPGSTRLPGLCPNPARFRASRCLHSLDTLINSRYRSLKFDSSVIKKQKVSQ